MGIDLIEHVRREDWNAFVSRQPSGTLYQSYEWGEIKQQQGWTPRYVAVCQDGEWVGAALALIKSIGSRAAIAYSPCGPVLSEPSLPVLQALLRAVADTVRSSSAIAWRVEPRVPSGDATWAQLFGQAGLAQMNQEWSYWNRPKYEMRLDLTPGEERLFQALHKKDRWSIRSGLGKLQIHSGTGDEALEAFHVLLRHTAMKKRIFIRDLAFFRQCRDTFSKAGMMQIFVARSGAKPVATGISIRYGDTATLFHMSSDYSVSTASWALQWAMVRWAIAEGCRTYDFAGTGTSFPPKSTDKGYGVYLFKKSFGPTICQWYGYADFPFRSALYRVFRTVEASLPYGERVFLDMPKAWRYRSQAALSSLTQWWSRRFSRQAGLHDRRE